MNIGECTVIRTPTGAEVLHADPVIHISAEMLDEIERGYGADCMTLTRDDVLTIRATNRTVVYRIDRDAYDFERDSYRAEWPD